MKTRVQAVPLTKMRGAEARISKWHHKPNDEIPLDTERWMRIWNPRLHAISPSLLLDP